MSPDRARKQAHQAFLIALLALAISLLANGVGYYESSRLDRELCEIHRTQLERAQKTLPTFAYFKEHPNEMRTQLALIREQLAELGECEPNPIGFT